MITGAPVKSTTPTAVVLSPVRLHWITEVNPDAGDLCAHSPVEFRIGEAIIVAPESGDWTVSAAGLFLLRTLAADHRPDAAVAVHLFPCCGMSYYAVSLDPPRVDIPGCVSGANCWVRHDHDGVAIEGPDGRVHHIAGDEWRSAVFAFCDAVRKFYDESPARQPYDQHDADGFATFLAEWDSLRGG